MDKRLHVCILVDKPLPFEHPTGIGVVAFELAKALSKLGVAVYLICRGTNAMEVINENLKVQRIMNFTRDNIRYMLNLHNKEKFDIVITFSSITFPMLLIAKFIHVPTIAYYSEVLKRPLINTLMQKIMLELADRIVCVSYNTKKEVVKHFRVPETKINVIYNGVNLNIFKPLQQTDRLLKLREEYGLRNFHPILFSLGVLQKRKGQHYVVKSLPYILRQFPNCCYVNVGGFYSQDYVIQLKNLAAKLKVEGNIRFLKHLPQAKLVELINLADICIHPTLHEGFGLAVLEEMACKKPVVAFNNSSIPEIIEHMKNGMLVKTGDISGLASTVIELLDDSCLSKVLAENARKRVEENFTWQKTATKFLEVLQQTCKQNTR